MEYKACSIGDRLVVEKRRFELVVHDMVTDLPLVGCLAQAIARMIGVDDSLDAFLEKVVDAV
jgi:hypothetical protein